MSDAQRSWCLTEEDEMGLYFRHQGASEALGCLTDVARDFRFVLADWDSSQETLHLVEEVPLDRIPVSNTSCDG
jgi:hypothetical protein